MFEIIKKIAEKLGLKKKYNFKSFGKYSVVKSGTFFGEENISIGDDVYIGPEAYWYGHGGIELGDNIVFGPKTTVWTVNHNYESEDALPYDEVDFYKTVKINSNVWVGLGVRIAPGVEIGEGAVLGMGSVVVKDVPPLAVVGGNPAKVIKFRDSETYEKTKGKDCFKHLERKRAGLKKKIVKN